MGLEEIVSFTAVPNEPSQRVMQRIGFRHEPALDFDHPLVPEGNWLRRHVLYRLDRKGWEGLVKHL
ncbi:GNAT family N-acetyltransferase [Pedomonas mirosovicensis]|uniref:GNAT family N-acetyltransferase n=1 Tax=Pedomonas mirosovicensis TaxID=2908641 RepID=UPI0035BC3AD9